MFSTLDLPTDPVERLEVVEGRAAEIGAVINQATAELIDLVAFVHEEGLCDQGELSLERWVAWRLGLSKPRAAAIVSVARRREELPTVVELLAAGSLSVDQAAIVARHVPADYEAEATEMAREMTVATGTRILSRVGWDVPKPGEKPAAPWRRTRSTSASAADAPAAEAGQDEAELGTVEGTVGGSIDASRQPERHPSLAPVAEVGVDRRCGSFTDEDGTWRLSAALDADEGAVVDQALRAAREDLYRQRKAEAGDSSVSVTMADAFVAVAEASLRSGQAAHPGSDRYRVLLHHECGPDHPVTSVHGGAVLPAGLARLHTCDGSARSVLDVGGHPVGIVAAHRIVPQWLRTVIEHRDRTCRVPGCDATRHLQIHHIVHWEDGGPTTPANLLALCGHHHRSHHLGLLGIEGDPELASGVPGSLHFTNRAGRSISLTPPTAAPPLSRPVADRPYPPTTDEPVEPWAIWFNPPPPARPAPPNRYGGRSGGDGPSGGTPASGEDGAGTTTVVRSSRTGRSGRSGPSRTGPGMSSPPGTGPDGRTPSAPPERAEPTGPTDQRDPDRGVVQAGHRPPLGASGGHGSSRPLAQRRSQDECGTLVMASASAPVLAADGPQGSRAAASGSPDRGRSVELPAELGTVRAPEPPRPVVEYPSQLRPLDPSDPAGFIDPACFDGLTSEEIIRLASLAAVEPPGDYIDMTQYDRPARRGRSRGGRP